jgi:transposase-like protein
MADQRTQIILSAKDETRAAIDSVKSGLNSIQASGNGIAQTFGSLKGALAGLGIGLVAREMVAFARSTIDAADALNDMSKRTGISVTALSGWRIAAEQSGTSLESIAGGLRKLSQYMTADGDKLAAIGVNAKTANEAFLQLADVLNSMPVDSPERMALATKILGKSAGDLLPLLSEGSDKLREMVKAGSDLSPGIESLAKNSDAFNDELAITNGLISAGAGAIVDEMLPALTKWLQIINGTRPPSEFAADLFDEVLDATQKLNELKAQQAEGGILGMFVTDNDIAIRERYIEQTKARLNKAIAENDRAIASAAARFDAAIKKPEKGAVQAILNPTTGGAKKPDDKTFENYQRDVAAVVSEIDNLNAGEQSNIEKLQDKLDALTRLDPVLRDYLQSTLDLARATDVSNAFQSAQNAGIDAQIEAMNELADAEKAAAEDRDRTFAEMSASLRAENEDLNVGLIESDKKRIRAQIDLEYQRSIDRINGLMLENEQAQELIDQETENYELRVKQLETTKSLAQDLGLTFTSAFEDAIVGGSKFSDVLKSLADDIERILVRRTITEPLTKGIDGLLSGSGVTDGIGKWFSNLFGGGKASGGYVDPSKFYLVGEQGPELFSPSMAGNIIPNGAVGGAGAGGGGVVVNLIEAPGSGGQVNSSTDTNGMTTIDIMVEQIESKMNRNISRGTGIAPTLEGMYGLNRAVGAYR